MRVVKNIFIGFFVIWFLFLLFMPKEEIYYKLESFLATKDIKINETTIESTPFSLTLYNADVYVKGVKLATIKKVNIFTLLFYTTVNIEDLFLDESLRTLVPTEIDNVTLTHAVWNPVKLDIKAQGIFGSATGMITIPENKIHIDFNNSKLMSPYKSKLQHNEKGWYYETSF